MRKLYDATNSLGLSGVCRSSKTVFAKWRRDDVVWRWWQVERYLKITKSLKCDLSRQHGREFPTLFKMSFTVFNLCRTAIASEDNSASSMYSTFFTFNRFHSLKKRMAKISSNREIFQNKQAAWELHAKGPLHSQKQSGICDPLPFSWWFSCQSQLIEEHHWHNKHHGSLLKTLCYPWTSGSHMKGETNSANAWNEYPITAK